jgi:hypothetical protein
MMNIKNLNKISLPLCHTSISKTIIGARTSNHIQVIQLQFLCSWKEYHVFNVANIVVTNRLKKLIQRVCHPCIMCFLIYYVWIIIKMEYFVERRILTCLSKQTFKWGGSPNWGPSSYYRVATLMVGWDTNMSVELGSTPNLTSFMTHISVRKEGLRKRTWKNVLDALNLQYKQKLLLDMKWELIIPSNEILNQLKSP